MINEFYNRLKKETKDFLLCKRGIQSSEGGANILSLWVLESRKLNLLLDC